MTVGIILAAGQGKRLNCRLRNKTSLEFIGKPLVYYGAKLMQSLTRQTVIVTGAFADSVKDSLRDFPDVIYANQRQRLGTGHAVQVAVRKLTELAISPDLVLVGYGDHMMYYTPKVINQLITDHQHHQAVISLISTDIENPDSFAWGRIIRDSQGMMTRIVEQKDATPEERLIKECNAGFYCFDFAFLKRNLPKLTKSPATGEYYLTDLIEIAQKQQLPLVATNIPFKYVGIGINTAEQLQESQELYHTLNVE